MYDVSSANKYGHCTQKNAGIFRVGAWIFPNFQNTVVFFDELSRNVAHSMVVSTHVYSM